MLNARANAQGSLDVVKEGALDPYVFIREGYLQTREHLATDGKSQAANDVDNEFGDDTAKPSTNKKAATTNNSSANDKANYALHLTAAEQSSNSFGGVTQSFDNTAKSFENASSKIDQLEKQKQSRKAK
jgi:phospholipid-binding lipoprotein MlaA